MGADIRGKINFLEVVSGGEDSIKKHLNGIVTGEELKRFYELVVWGENTCCIKGLNLQGECLDCDHPGLTNLGRVVYEGRKNLILK